MNQIKQDLLATRELIKSPDNWLQLHGGFVGKSPSGSHCLGNATYAACDYDVVRQKLVLKHLGFNSLPDVWEWNDNKNRTHADVLVLLDDGISRAAE